MEEADDHPHFEEDDGAGEAAGHPLAVELDLALEDEDHGYGGGQEPDAGVGDRGDGEGAGFAESLLEVLDVDAHGCADDDAGYVEASHDAVGFGETLAETVGKLERPEKERACGGEAVG